MVILTDVNGIFLQDIPLPSKPAETVFFSVESSEDEELPDFVVSSSSRIGPVGTAEQLRAAAGAVRGGVRAVIIANGAEKDVLLKVCQGETAGTLCCTKAVHVDRSPPAVAKL